MWFQLRAQFCKQKNHLPGAKVMFMFKNEKFKSPENAKIDYI